MFNPDSPNEKKENPAQPPTTGTALMSEKVKLRYYILEGGMSECYGFRLTPDKRLEIADLNKLNRFDGQTKSLLRELYAELKK